MALLAYGPRYAAILGGTRLGFVAPKELSQLVVAERLQDTAGTDFGALSVPPTVDRERSCGAAEVKRFETILRAGWRAFDRTVRGAPRRGARTISLPAGRGRDAGPAAHAPVPAVRG